MILRNSLSESPASQLVGNKIGVFVGASFPSMKNKQPHYIIQYKIVWIIFYVCVLPFVANSYFFHSSSSCKWGLWVTLFLLKSAIWLDFCGKVRLLIPWCTSPDLFSCEWHLSRANGVKFPYLWWLIMMPYTYRVSCQCAQRLYKVLLN